MSKRGADRQITKDDPEDGGEGEGMEEQGGTWKPASQETLATRQPIKARRKAISAPTGVAMPAFNFGGQMPTKAAEPTPDAAAASPAAAAPAAASLPAAAEPNALQRLVAAQAAKGWACPTCEVRNPHTLTICAACQEPNPNPSAPAAATSAPTAAAAAAPAAAAPNALQLLAAKNKAQSWECDSCMTQNKTDATKCGACEAPRPGSSGTAAVASAAPTPAASGFSFGAQPAGDAVAAAAPATFSGGFSFGSDSASSFAPAAAAASSSSSSGGFSFGASEPSASAATFGAVPSFSFGGSAGSSLVSFGSVATGGAVGFGSAGASNGSAEGGEGGEGASPPQFEESSAETLSGAGAELASEFKNASKDPTGEEDDEVHLRMVSKVFQLKRLSKVQAPAADAHFDPSMPPAVQQPTELPIDSDQGELKYVEQGTGELHVNTVLDPVTKKTRARLVLREEKTKRSVLNAPLFVGMSHQLVGERQLRFQSLDLKGKMATFTLKFKQKSEAQEVDKEIEACLKRIQA